MPKRRKRQSKIVSKTHNELALNWFTVETIRFNPQFDVLSIKSISHLYQNVFVIYFSHFACKYQNYFDSVKFAKQLCKQKIFWAHPVFQVWNDRYFLCSWKLFFLIGKAALETAIVAQCYLYVLDSFSDNVIISYNFSINMFCRVNLMMFSIREHMISVLLSHYFCRA